MKRVVYILSVILAITLSVKNCYSQLNRRNISDLDSIAFTALEQNSDSTSIYAHLLLEESENQKAYLYKINALTILGIVNKEKGYYVTALNHYLNALNTAEFSNDLPRVSACYNNIGQIYQLQQNYVKANSYYHLSLNIEDSLSNPL